MLMVYYTAAEQFSNGNPSSKNVSFTLINKVQSCLFECYKMLNVANVVVVVGRCTVHLKQILFIIFFPFSISMPHTLIVES